MTFNICTRKGIRVVLDHRTNKQLVKDTAVIVIAGAIVLLGLFGWLCYSILGG